MLRVALSVLAFLVLILGVSRPAFGQTTQPSEKPAAAPAVVPDDQIWPKTVEALARALASGDRAALGTMLSANSFIRRFASSTPEDAQRLMDRFTKSTVIGQHAYLHPPLVMAADIAADFKNAAMIPEKEKARYLIDDDTEMKRANATAVQWAVEQLNARQGVPVGVIVMWTPRPAPIGQANAASTAPIFDALFILCRGEEISPRQFKIDLIVYGHPITEGNDR